MNKREPVTPPLPIDRFSCLTGLRYFMNIQTNSNKTNVSLKRRGFVQNGMTAVLGLVFLIFESEAGVIRRRRRRIRRRVRRRVRRRIVWRLINGKRFVVIPVDIEIGDELIMDDGTIATVAQINKKNIILNVNSKEQTLPAVYEGSVNDQSDL